MTRHCDAPKPLDHAREVRDRLFVDGRRRGRSRSHGGERSADDELILGGGHFPNRV